MTKTDRLLYALLERGRLSNADAAAVLGLRGPRSNSRARSFMHYLAMLGKAEQDADGVWLPTPEAEPCDAIETPRQARIPQAQWAGQSATAVPPPHASPFDALVAALGAAA